MTTRRTLRQILTAFLRASSSPDTPDVWLAGLRLGG
jgi:hypothetical protein